MGKLLPQFQKSIVEDIKFSITSNNANYYAFAANPIAYNGSTPQITTEDYSTTFVNDWQLLFGKKLANTDITPVILNNAWTSGVIYNRYDNTIVNLSNYYVITPPSEPGGDYNVYVCIDNANNSPSTATPDQIQPSTFTKEEDGYSWRYITTIPNNLYNRTATSKYAPIVANSSISAAAHNYSGVEVIMIKNSGSGYECYTNGIVKEVTNNNPSNTVIRISNDSSFDEDYYTGGAIYFYNTGSIQADIKTIIGYTVNVSSGAKYVKLDSNVDTTYVVTANYTHYDISPAVVFTSDGDLQPKARTIVNPSTNGISKIVILDQGNDINWCNVHIQSNTSYGSGANLYAIVSPPGGHGYNPEAQLRCLGLVVSFEFANSENGTIPSNTVYNKIGILKNPFTLSEYGKKTSNPWDANTFSAVLDANVTATFTVGDTVIGEKTGARGTVAFCNGSVIYLTGDKNFANAAVGYERIVSTTDSSTNSELIINTRGDVYTKDITPFYVQNVINVERAEDRTESFKLIIKI